MRTASAWAAVIAIFLVGILVGVLATLVWTGVRPGPAPPPGPGPGGGPPPDGAFFLERMGRALELTDEQSEEIAEILRASREEAEGFRREMHERFREHMDRTRAAIEEVLTPEQRERFERFNRRYGRWAERFLMERMRERGPRPGPGRGGRLGREP